MPRKPKPPSDDPWRVVDPDPPLRSYEDGAERFNGSALNGLVPFAPECRERVAKRAAGYVRETGRPQMKRSFLAAFLALLLNTSNDRVANAQANDPPTPSEARILQWWRAYAADTVDTIPIPLPPGCAPIDPAYLREAPLAQRLANKGVTGVRAADRRDLAGEIAVRATETNAAHRCYQTVVIERLQAELLYLSVSR